MAGRDRQRVAFRTVASELVGYGHVRRCLSLATALRKRDMSCLFLLQATCEVARLVQNAGFETQRFEHDPLGDRTGELTRNTDATVLVVDAYDFGTEAIARVARPGLLLVAVDDLADRDMDVDLVVNGGAGAELLDYGSHPRTTYLLGPRYALLRPEFAHSPARSVADPVGRVLISTGGSDPLALSPRLLNWATEVLPGVQVDLVLGPLAGGTSETLATPQVDGLRVHRDVENMRSLMLAADIAVSGGGQTTYELAATGTPTVAVCLADNQLGNLQNLSAAGALVWAGDRCDSDLEVRVKQALTRVAGDATLRSQMGTVARALVDGRGASRVALAIRQLSSGKSSRTSST